MKTWQTLKQRQKMDGINVGSMAVMGDAVSDAQIKEAGSDSVVLYV